MICLKKLIALFRGISKRCKKEIEEFNRFVGEGIERDMWLQERRWKKAGRYFKCRFDFHDYPDDIENGAPCHFTEFLCSYCGKKFGI